MSKPLVSIIIPVYNVELYLSKCIDSILAQSFTDWECILVDDGSKDKSGSICDNYALKDNRIKVESTFSDFEFEIVEVKENEKEQRV